MAEVITDPKLRQFVHSSVSKTFGLSVDTVAVKCKNWGRFKNWLGSDVTRIKKVLNIVKDNGVSPAFFAAYEKTEGFNRQWGWLNRTYIKGSPEEDAKSTALWIVNQADNTTALPAWFDYGNKVHFVPQSVQTAGNADFKNMAKGNIGKVVIAGTAAATWEVYYPNGLLASYNKVQNYAKPITGMMNTILDWGGKLDSDEKNPINPPVKPDPDVPPQKDYVSEVISDTVSDFTKKLLKKIEDMLTVRLYEYGNSQLKANKFVKVEQLYPNVYKIKPNLNFNNVINDSLKEYSDSFKDLLDKTSPIKKPDEEYKPDKSTDKPKPTNGKMYFPVDYTARGINFFKPPYVPGSIQADMDFGGYRDDATHPGYDIGGGYVKGHKVYAIRDCEVLFIGNDGYRGFLIKVKNISDDKYIIYQHLVSNSNKVKKGDIVGAGQHIATMGDTPSGYYSIHLHVEVDTTGKFEGYKKQDNPREYLQVIANNKTSLPNPAKK